MAQALFSQDAAPFNVLQALPHAPQWAGVVVRAVSQPLSTFPSQFPQPPLQVMPQAPLLQNAVPLFELQTRAHAPQLAGSLPSDRSQPLAASASQLPQPALHVMVQALPMQDGVPLLESHTTPQPPQWVCVVRVSTSQPSPGAPLQLA